MLLNRVIAAIACQQAVTVASAPARDQPLVWLLEEGCITLSKNTLRYRLDAGECNTSL